MTFSQLEIGDIFEYRDAATRRVAVKISDRKAWLLQSRRAATMAYNRNVWPPDMTGPARLMRDRENRLCVMHELANGRLAGFSVIPVAFAEGEQADFTRIEADSKQQQHEFNIMLKRISQSLTSAQNLVTALDTILLNK